MNPDEELKHSSQATDDSLKYLTMYLGSKGYTDVKIYPWVEYADSDFKVFVNDKFFCFLEVKVRRHKCGYYQEEKVPFRKHSFGYTMKNEMKLPSYYLIKWEDKYGILNLANKPDHTGEQVARHDRGEEKDFYAFYKLGQFTII